MIKATLKTPDGKRLLLIGLSFGNLDKFRNEAGETFIKIDGETMDLPIDVIIFSGETEAHLHTMLKDGIGSDTKINIDPKLKT